jgi:hypothetical protein
MSADQTPPLRLREVSSARPVGTSFGCADWPRSQDQQLTPTSIAAGDPTFETAQRRLPVIGYWEASLFTLANEQERHFRKVKQKLDAAGTNPAPNPEKVGATFCRRTAVGRSTMMSN